jgi:hypothetical protein
MRPRGLVRASIQIQRMAAGRKGRPMPNRIVTLLIAVTLAGSLFGPDVQARGVGAHGGGLGGHIGGFHGMHISSGVHGTRMGSDLGRIHASSAGGDYNIMRDDYSIMAPEKGSSVQKPEPWLAPRYRSPRGTLKSVVIPKSEIVSPPSASAPPSVFVPQTGQTFQSLPTLSGSGPGGAETFQDRAASCAHEAGVYGRATSGSFMGACINQ